MLDLEDIKDIINTDLSVIAGTSFTIDIGTEIIDYKTLPKEKLGFYRQDKNVPALISTISGFYEAIPDQDVYTGVYRLSFLVAKRQLTAFMSMLGDYIKAKNGIATTYSNYVFVPTFDLVIPGNATLVQGVNRVKVSTDIIITVGDLGIQLNGIEVYLDTYKLPLRGFSFVSAKGVDSYVNNNSGGTSKGDPLSKTIGFTFSLVYTSSNLCKALMAEALDIDGTYLETTHALTYWDTSLGTTSTPAEDPEDPPIITKNTKAYTVILQSITPVYQLSTPTIIQVSAVLAR